jgi:hypothetical protein
MNDPHLPMYRCGECGRSNYPTVAGTCTSCKQLRAQKAHGESMRRLQEEQNNLLQSIAYSASQNTPPKKKKRVKRRKSEMMSKSTRVLNLWKNRHEEMIEPVNQIAQLAFAEAAILAIEENGIELSEFSSIANKRSFNTLVKKTRKVVKEADEDTRQALKTFQHEYEAYVEGRETGVRAFVAAPSCEWVPTDPPNWEPGEPVPAFQSKPAPEWTVRVPPAWIPGEKPEPELVPIPERPAEVHAPLPQPRFEDFIAAARWCTSWTGVKMGQDIPDMSVPVIIDDNGQNWCCVRLVDRKWVDVNPDNGEPITTDNVPSLDETRRRFPTKPTGFLRAIFGAPVGWHHAAKYEQSLRDWAASVKAYKAFCENLPIWEIRSREAQAENERILKDVYPDQIKHFEQAEKKRRADWKRALKAHEEAEKVRRSEWEFACIIHEETERSRREAHERACKVHAEAEKKRREEWEQSCVAHETAERRRREAWQKEILAHAAEEETRLEKWKAEIDDCASTLQRLGKTINEFLEEHPDIQLLYSKVDWQKDAEEVLRRAREKPELPPLELPPCDHWQNNSQYADELMENNCFTVKSEEERVGLQSLLDNLRSVFCDKESPDVQRLAAWRNLHPEARDGLSRRIGGIEEAIRSDWHHAKLGDSPGYFRLRAVFHAYAGNLSPYEALHLYYEATDANKQGHHEVGLRLYLQSHVKDPQLMWAANDYAWELASSREVSQRNGVVAVKYGLQVCERSQWHCWSFIDTLAAAYAQCGEAESAVACARRALQLCPPKSEGYVSRCIALYETGKSYPVVVSERESLERAD